MQNHPAWRGNSNWFADMATWLPTIVCKQVFTAIASQHQCSLSFLKVCVRIKFPLSTFYQDSSIFGMTCMNMCKHIFSCERSSHGLCVLAHSLEGTSVITMKF